MDKSPVLYATCIMRYDEAIEELYEKEQIQTNTEIQPTPNYEKL